MTKNKSFEDIANGKIKVVVVVDKPLGYEPEPEVRATVVVTKDENDVVQKVQIKREKDGRMYDIRFNNQEQVKHAINDAEMIAKQLNEGDMNWREASSYM